ncbi:uncharacterized protein MONOS_13518 [Monocercomonoides exilis]|uniref:uncharacterized protein n=1 Tax=Monocercomonoides exilis TaxID=2049356 RepID=UPI00355A85FD|nr:hypothetical protein MONOS_13518 [Monocercomonoides exilis]|eukprot:MONOS_13518.1-p1 / transcript=MONOS_13518.1 / gene=MONOS_13518 / organism=Monocercomonoides_exilis_PA203 / gene_product=unspecified product / transcript_product=unspecified product / location=Mono_scaffold00839:8837-9451(-) / protein_length=188 / sequence_SO=supercontig / SO=protein_coding / is_pseudo=false
MLSVSLMGLLPSLSISVGTKSGSNQIFDAADVNAFQSICDLFDPSLLQICRSPQLKYFVKLKDEVMGRGVAVCEVVKIVEKGLAAAGLRKEDVVEEGEGGNKGGNKGGGKEGEEEGKEEGKEDGGREGGDGNEVKGGCPTAHREFVERIKENQMKLEEAMALLVVEALGLSELRFVKAEAEADSDKQ